MKISKISKLNSKIRYRVTRKVPRVRLVEKQQLQSSQLSYLSSKIPSLVETFTSKRDVVAGSLFPPIQVRAHNITYTKSEGWKESSIGWGRIIEGTQTFDRFSMVEGFFHIKSVLGKAIKDELNRDKLNEKKDQDK